MSVTAEEVDVVVVGGGPAGLAAAVELRRLGMARVVVLEREAEAGGVPRHTDHTGFGVRDLHRLMRGPRYAATRVALALAAGADVRTSATATAWTDGTGLAVTSPRGLGEIRARAVLLATGCRERSRAARLVPGTRPAGVLTTGALQQLVYVHHERPGTRVVVVGAEHVSFSAVETLAHGGARTVAMVTEHERHQTVPALYWLSAGRRGVPVLASTRLARIAGRERVEAVDVTDARGETRRIACDTVVFTGDWIPDHELARHGRLALDPGTRAPRVDEALRTSRPGVFAAGNLVHPAEAGDVAALGGRRAARAVHAFLAARGAAAPWPADETLAVACAPPLVWASPSAVTPAVAHATFLLRVRTFTGPVRLTLRQAGHVLWARHERCLVPNRPIRARVGAGVRVDPSGGPLTFAAEPW